MLRIVLMIAVVALVVTAAVSGRITSVALGEWIAALLTLSIFSFLYKDNPVYKFAEHIFIGVSAGYFVALEYWNVFIPNLWTPLVEGLRQAAFHRILDVGGLTISLPAFPGMILLVPFALGLLLFTRFHPRLTWLSRWSMAAMIGSYAGLAIIGALLLFLIPAGKKSGEFLLDWKTAARVPWDVIILFGGGLSLASGFKASGLDQWIGESITVLHGAGPVVLISAVALLTIFLTEVTSNTATSAMLIPIISGVAISMSIHPYGPIVAACVAASYAFMLPVATPPNAVVFGSRQVTITQMIRAGLALNIFGWILITLLVSWLLPLIWKIDPAALPSWIPTGG